MRLWHITDEYQTANLFFVDDDVISALETYLASARLPNSLRTRANAVVLAGNTPVAVADRAEQPEGMPVLDWRSRKARIIGYAADPTNAAIVLNMHRMRHYHGEPYLPLAAAQWVERLDAESARQIADPSEEIPANGVWVPRE